MMTNPYLAEMLARQHGMDMQRRAAQARMVKLARASHRDNRDDPHAPAVASSRGWRSRILAALTLGRTESNARHVSATSA